MTVRAASAATIPAGREQTLVERARRMEADAWDEIFSEHHKAIHRYVALRVTDAATAEDIASDVFVEAVKGIGRYRYRGISFRAWLYRIAHNLTADYRRRMARRPVASLPEGDGAAGSGDDFAPAFADRDELRIALEQLTGEQQQVVILRFFEGLSVAEVAAATGRREGAVKALQHRALRRMRAYLEGRNG